MAARCRTVAGALTSRRPDRRPGAGVPHAAACGGEQPACPMAGAVELDVTASARPGMAIAPPCPAAGPASFRAPCPASGCWRGPRAVPPGCAGEGVAGEPRAGRTPLPAWHPGVRRLRRAALGARRAGRVEARQAADCLARAGSPTPRWRRPQHPARPAPPCRTALRRGTGASRSASIGAGTAEVLDLATCEVLDPRLVGAVPGAARPRPAVAGAAPAGLGGAEPAGYGADLCCARMARSRPAKGRCWRASRGRPACPASPGRGRGRAAEIAAQLGPAEIALSGVTVGAGRGPSSSQPGGRGGDHRGRAGRAAGAARRAGAASPTCMTGSAR